MKIKNVVYFLALCFLLEWAYTTKIKPFIKAEFGLKDEKKPNDEDTSVSTGGFMYGLDISKWQGDERELLDKKKDSLSFVICRATNGKTTDPDFLENWRTLKQKGLIRGAYHFYLCDEDPLVQARNFLSVIDTLLETDLPLAIDIESPYINKNCKNIIENILSFIKAVEAKTKRRMMIYVNLSDGDRFLYDHRFAEYPLWVAHPSPVLKAPSVPRAWKQAGWVLWQRSDTYTIDRIVNDFDVFNGNADSLKRFIRNTHLK